MIPNRKIKLLILKKEIQDRNAQLSKYISHEHNSISTGILVPLV